MGLNMIPVAGKDESHRTKLLGQDPIINMAINPNTVILSFKSYAGRGSLLCD